MSSFLLLVSAVKFVNTSVDHTIEVSYGVWVTTRLTLRVTFNTFWTVSFSQVGKSSFKLITFFFAGGGATCAGGATTGADGRGIGFGLGGGVATRCGVGALGVDSPLGRDDEAAASSFASLLRRICTRRHRDRHKL